MDLSRFETREKSHQGVNIPLVIGGEVVLGDDDKPVTFTMRGIADPEVNRVLLANLAAPPSRTQEEVLQSDLRLARASCVGWSSNWMHEGEKLEFSAASINRIFSVPVIRKALLGEIAKDKHFMKGA